MQYKCSSCGPHKTICHTYTHTYTQNQTNTPSSLLCSSTAPLHSTFCFCFCCSHLSSHSNFTFAARFFACVLFFLHFVWILKKLTLGHSIDESLKRLEIWIVSWLNRNGSSPESGLILRVGGI